MKTFVLICLILSTQFFCAGQANQKRLALVIGNAHYQFTNPLKNLVNDARAIASSLQGLGFEVMESEDVTQANMKQAINTFGQKLKGYDVGLFYYAGHGVQSKGVNYMIPVDAELKNEEEIEFDCVPADRVLSFMETAATKVNLIVLDACRNNPFARSWQRSVGGGGLAMMDAPKGSLIAYATSPGRTASDGESSNGLYTSALLKYMRNPSLTIEQVFKQVRNEVNDKSGGVQIPWETTSLTGEDFYLGKGAKNLPPAVTTSNATEQRLNAQSRNLANLKSVKVSPEDKGQAEIFYAQGKISYDAYKNEKAIEDFTKAIALNPLYADAYYWRGNSYYSIKDYDKAIEDQNVAILINPAFSEYYYWRGNAYYAVRQDDKALADYSHAISLKADYAQAYYWKGRTYYDLMQNEKAIENFDKAVQLNQDYAEAIFWRGQVFYANKKYEQAIADYTHTLALKNYDAESFYWRANAYYSLKKYAEAIQDFNAAIAQKPEYAEAYFYRGKVEYTLAQDPEALADFKKAAELKPTYADAYYWQGVLSYTQKDYEGTIALCTKAIDINDQLADGFYYRAIAKYALKRDDEAILDFDQSIALKPAADAYYWRGMSRYDQQDYADAIPDFTKSIELEPSGNSSHNYFYFRANSYYVLKMDEYAIKDFTQAISLKSDFADAWYYRGCAYFYHGQKDLALADLNKAIELAPANSKYLEFKTTNFK